MQGEHPECLCQLKRQVRTDNFRIISSSTGVEIRDGQFDLGGGGGGSGRLICVPSFFLGQSSAKMFFSPLQYILFKTLRRGNNLFFAWCDREMKKKNFFYTPRFLVRINSRSPSIFLNKVYSEGFSRPNLFSAGPNKTKVITSRRKVSKTSLIQKKTF